MNILITGSTGYVGSNFISTFKDQYDFVKFSLLDKSLDDLSVSNVDVVLHCAALVHQKIDHDYEKYHDINVDYPVTLAKKAKEHGVKQFIFLSTVAVYGDNIKKIDENSVCDPVSPYGKSKLEAEKKLQELSDENFTVSIVRPPMVYGKDAPGNMASLIKLVEKVPILPFAKIENRRSFIYIGNLIFAIHKIIENKSEGTLLVGDDRSISTTELVQLIAKELNRTIYLVKIPFFQSLLKSLKPSFNKRLYESLEIDNNSVKKALHFKNPYSVEQGVHFMIHGEKK